MYLDANVLASFLVSGHPLYATSAALIAQLLSDERRIVLSDLVVTESLWALARLAYCDTFGHRSYDVEFKQTTYVKNHAAIFGGAHAPKIAAVVDLVRTLNTLGRLVVSHPNNDEWVDQVERTHSWMRSDRMLPFDATHLAIAKKHARTLVTADEEFAKTGGISPSKLNMVWLKATPTVAVAPVSGPSRPERKPRRTKRHRRRR